MSQVVTFDEPTHTYTDVETGDKFISVTTLIGKYTPKFDSAYWSLYKAVQAVMEARGEWVSYKRKCGGWENVVTYLTKKDKKFPHWDLVRERRKEILADWERKRNEAASAGSDFHNKKESETITTPTEGVVGYTNCDIISKPVFDGDEIYAELLIYDRKLGVAGKADWVKREGKTIHINDYKTSKDVSREAFMSEVMHPPLAHLPNANYYKFSMQISIYAFMLERAGYEIGNLTVEHIDKITGESLGFIPIDYLRKEVVDLLRHYRDSKK